MGGVFVISRVEGAGQGSFLKTGKLNVCLVKITEFKKPQPQQHGADIVKDFKLVYIKWVDSFGVGSVWEELNDVKDEAHHCQSVGWLVGDGDNVKVLVPHISPRNESIGCDLTGCGDMAIPVQCIVELKELEI